MKRLLLFVLVMMTCVAGAEMISDGSGFDPGALRKSRFRYYGGATTEPSYTVILNHLISVDACCVNLWDNANFEGYPVNYTFPATEVTLNNNATNYIVADYNGGTPIIKVVTNVDLINESSVVPILTIYDAGGFLHTLNWDQLGEGLANKLHQRLVKTQRYQRESGLSMSMSNPGVDLTFEITEGRVWYGATREIIDAVDSTTDLTVLVEPNGNVIPRTTLNNTHYYNSGAYTELTANRYAINWIYRGIENQKHCYIMLGDGDYKLDEAQGAQPPAAPAIITSHAQLIAKVIIQKDSLNVYSLQSAFDMVFATAGVTNHNDLIGLNDGDYQHLTAAELAELQAIDTNYVATSALTLTLADYVLSSSLGTMAAEDTTDYVATSSLVTILLGYAALNGNIAEDFAIDHLSGVTASFTGDVDIAGDLTVGSAVDMTIVGDGVGNVTMDTVATLTVAADTEFTGVLDLSGANVIGLPESVATHNNLLGLNDGDYQHLTAAELAEVQAMDTNYVATSTLVTTLADYALTTSLGTMAAEDASDYVATSALTTTLADYSLTTDIAANYVATSTYDADIGSLSDTLEAILGVSSPTMQHFGFDYDTGMLMGYNITGGVDVTVPAAIDGVDVVSVANNFVLDANITSVDMVAAPITSVGNSAFSGCNYLTSVTLPSTLITIGQYAFYNAGLLSITVPSSVTTMDVSVFSGCDNLAAAAINANITTLPALTFVNCDALTDVTISPTITTIDTSAFYRCTTLTDTSFAAIITNITTINNQAFYDCDALTTIDVSGVTTINGEAFFDCDALTTVDVSGVTTLGKNIFSRCDALTTVTVDDEITQGMFAESPVTKVTIGTGASIYDDASVGANGTGFKAAYTTGGAGVYNYTGGNWVKE